MDLRLSVFHKHYIKESHGRIPFYSNSSFFLKICMDEMRTTMIIAIVVINASKKLESSFPNNNAISSNNLSVMIFSHPY